MAKYIENGDNKPTTKVIPKSASFCSTRALKKCQKVQTYPYEIYINRCLLQLFRLIFTNNSCKVYGWIKSRLPFKIFSALQKIEYCRGQM